MLFSPAATLLLALHAVFGGLLMRYKRSWLWLHLSAATWAVAVVMARWVCPLIQW